MIVVIQIAVNAALVATVCDIKMDAERNSKSERLLIQLEKKTHTAETGSGEASVMGPSEMRSIP